MNERVRTFLRLEHLFRLVDHFTRGQSHWDVRLSLNALLDVTDLIGRTDIKTELIKELERHTAIFKTLKENPDVDPQRLEIVQDDINGYLGALRDKNYQPGLSLKQDELINTVKQRNAILGGTCSFDIPSLHQWLTRPDGVQKRSLEIWQDDLRVIRKSVQLILNLIRNSSNPTRETAGKGVYQQSLEQNNSCQLIRIVLPAETPYYPEISAGKHRFTVRFMAQDDTACRPVQTGEDVEFSLHCCIL